MDIVRIQKILKLGKWLAAGVLLPTITFSGMEMTAYGASPSQTVRIVRPLETDEAENFTEPPEEYTDEDGAVYELEDWKLDRVPGSQVSRDISRQVLYRNVEAAQPLPHAIPVREVPAGTRLNGTRASGSQAGGIRAGGTQADGTRADGTQADGTRAGGTLEAAETQVLGETWSDDFSVPMIFHSYGAQVYELGNISMSAEDGFPPPEEYQGELLRILELPQTDYEITQLVWKGEPYTGPEGELCREAVASGRKRLVDYQVTYGGRVSWQLPDTWQLETVYRLRPLVVETVRETPEETLAAAKTPVTEINGPLEQGLWYWVRNGVVITIAAGLLGIMVGILILFVMWLKRERSDRED